MKPLVAALVAAGLATSAGAQDGRIVVLGDSVMDWNAAAGAAIADVTAGKLGRQVENLSVSGAEFTNTGWGARLNGLDIRAQFDFEPADWVVLTGGANDLAVDCACGDCAATLDDLISEDGRRGDVPDFVAEVAATGSRVLWVLYYETPAWEESDFSACVDEFALYHARLQRLAAASPALSLADAAQVIDRTDPGHYDPDLIHPSRDGSRLIGTLVARIIAESP